MKARGGAALLAGATLAMLLAVAPAAAAEGEGSDSRDDVILDLQKELREFRAEQERMRQEIAELRSASEKGDDDLDSAVSDMVRGLDTGYYAGPSGVPRPKATVDFGGYFSTRYVSSQKRGKHSSFVDMRLVPQMHAAISRNIHFDTEVEIEHAGAGGPADGEIVVEYAELSFVFDPRFVLKAGTLLIPFGQFNLNHDDPMNELSERPRVARFVVPAAFDLPGIGAEGVFEPEAGIVAYNVALTNGFRDAFDSEKGARNARGLFEEDDNDDKTVFGRLTFVPTETLIDALSVGASGAWGRLGAGGRGDDRLHGYGFDLQAKEGPWEFMGEYDRFSINRASGTPAPKKPNGELGPVRGLDGYYAQLLYRFRGDWLQGLPIDEGNATMALVARYDEVDLNDRVRGASGQDDETSWTLGINYRPTAKTVVKIEYRWADSPADGQDGKDRDFFAFEFATYF